MPRPKPPYQDEPVPGSVSLARKLRVAGARLKAKRPALGIQDFSDLLTRALSEYLERVYPGLITEIEAELIRSMYQQKPSPAALAAEEDGQTKPDKTIQAIDAALAKARRAAAARGKPRPNPSKHK